MSLDIPAPGVLLFDIQQQQQIQQNFIADKCQQYIEQNTI